MCHLQEQAVFKGEDHAILQRVRSCSSEPEVAVDYFRRILHPCPTCRLGAEAMLHPYLRDTTMEMKADLPRRSEFLFIAVAT